MINKTNKQRKKDKAKYTLKGTAKRPRLRVYRSNKHIYVQAIDDEKNIVITGVSSLNPDLVKVAKGKNKVGQAELVGELIGKKLNALKIQEVIFDRSYYKYHGRVKSLSEAVRKSSIKF